jgi:AraC-like DNA-binding protein
MVDTRGAYLISRPDADESTERGRREFWADYSDAYFLRGHHAYVSDGKPYRVHTVRQKSGIYTLHAFRQEGAKEVRHTARHSQQAQDLYHLFAVTHGDAIQVRRGETEGEVPPGHAVLATQSAPFDMRVGDFAGFVLAVPTAELHNRLNSRSPLEVAFDIHTGLGRIITDTLRGLHEERARLTARQFNATCDHLIELLCMLIVGDDVPGADHWRDIETAARQYIRRHSGERDLSLPSMATALGWSPRRLQEVMSRAGTTYREMVREERLGCARRMLADSAAGAVPIAEIAQRCGFASGGVLSTLFRERYGESPRDYRHRVIAP